MLLELGNTKKILFKKETEHRSKVKLKTTKSSFFSFKFYYIICKLLKMSLTDERRNLRK